MRLPSAALTDCTLQDAMVAVAGVGEIA